MNNEERRVLGIDNCHEKFLFFIDSKNPRREPCVQCLNLLILKSFVEL